MKAKGWFTHVEVWHRCLPERSILHVRMDTQEREFCICFCVDERQKCPGEMFDFAKHPILVWTRPQTSPCSDTPDSNNQLVAELCWSLTTRSLKSGVKWQHSQSSCWGFSRCVSFPRFASHPARGQHSSAADFYLIKWPPYRRDNNR